MIDFHHCVRQNQADGLLLSQNYPFSFFVYFEWWLSICIAELLEGLGVLMQLDCSFLMVGFKCRGY